MRFILSVVLLVITSNLYAMYEIDPDSVPTDEPGVTVGLISNTTQAPAPGDPKIRILCTFAKAGKFDPIVFPGQNNAGHHHTFFGNTGISPKSTGSTLINSGGSTCNGGAYLRSSFWIPSTLDSRTNEFIKPFQAIIYYNTFAHFDNSKAYQYVKRIPHGLKILPGKSVITQWDKPNFSYNCVDLANNEKESSSKGFPICSQEGYIRYAVQNWPECWDGKNLDSSDHRSHMAFATSGDGLNNPNECPSTHPVRIPGLHLLVYYPVKAAGETQYWRLASDNPDVAPGSTLHADYFGGVNYSVQDLFIQNCIKAKSDCRMGLLGLASDGRYKALYGK